MASILHILNGDSTAHSFYETGLDGDVLVWREVLSQGPLVEDISSAAFWNARSEWICGGFNETPDNYAENVIKPLEKLSEPYEEINLWFEFDLHCQCNLLGVMMMIAKRVDLSEQAIYLICPDEFPEKPNFKGMGELNGEELEYLYDNIRVQLNEFDFTLAGEAWSLYMSGDDRGLEKWLNENTFWSNLSLLKPALIAHLARIRVNKSGLNHIEQKLLDIYNYGIKDKPSIYNAFWQTEKIYGMGDLEINIYLKRLADKGLISL